MKTVEVMLPAELLHSGFWLYVWRVETPAGREVVYVGRTGDSSSANAAPPYRRFGQHLGHVKASNALRTHLNTRDIQPESCRRFTFVAHGPLFDKQRDMESHKPVRDIVAALEMKLADALAECGYKVKSRKALDQELWSSVRDAFAPHFPRLREEAIETPARSGQS
jgi:hypothetical protein